MKVSIDDRVYSEAGVAFENSEPADEAQEHVHEVINLIKHVLSGLVRDRTEVITARFLWIGHDGRFPGFFHFELRMILRLDFGKMTHRLEVRSPTYSLEKKDFREDLGSFLNNKRQIAADFTKRVVDELKQHKRSLQDSAAVCGQLASVIEDRLITEVST